MERAEDEQRFFAEVIFPKCKDDRALQHCYLYGYISEESYRKGEFVLQTPPSFPEDLHLMIEREDKAKEIDDEKRIAKQLAELFN